MKKRMLLPAFVLLMLILFCSVTAAADGFCNLGTIYAGAELNQPVAAVREGTIISCNDLPVGLNINVYASCIYVSGAPMSAGDYSFTIFTSDPSVGSIMCSVSVLSNAPSVYTSSDVDCYVGDRALLSVSAGTTASGFMSYQWYAASSPAAVSGYPIPGANSPEYSADTGREGTQYYYCAVSSGNDMTVSDVIRVSVMPLNVQSITVKTLPNEVTYRSGVIESITGLSVQVNYSNGTSKVLTEGYTVTPGSYDSNTHMLMLTVNYQGYSCSAPVYVTESEPEISGIGMVKLPDKQEYAVGESVDGRGLVFRVYYKDGTYEDMSDDYSLGPTVFTAEGTQTVTLFYKEFVCTFTTTVKPYVSTPDNLEIISKPVRLSYNVGDRLDTAGLIIRETVNGVTTNISSGYSVEPSAFTRAGTQTVNVFYNGRVASFTVDVAEPVAAPTPTPSPTPSPVPTAGSSIRQSVKKANSSSDTSEESNKGLLIIVLVLALLALGALGIYILIQENGGIEELRYKLECAVYDLRQSFNKKR